MLGNHIKIAVRNLLRYPGYTAINLFGLTVGLAVCFLVAAYIAHELSFEDCHSKKDRIYRVQLDLNTESTGTMELAGAAPPLGPVLREASTDVEAIARFHRYAIVKMAAGTSIRKRQTVFAVEPEFFSIFDVEPLRGDPKADLVVPNTIYLTERLANSLFGRVDPIGKTVTMEGQNEFNVAGILKNFPTNTKLNCDALVSYSTLEARGRDMSDWMEVWQDYLFVLLRPGAEVTHLEALLPSILKRHLSEEEQSKQKYVVQSLGDLYFDPRSVNELAPKGNANNLFLFGAVALVTLAIACVNFVNHTTARAASRIKELSVRKIVGASRTELARQLMTESFLVAALASVAAAAVFEVSSPVLNVFFGRNLDVGLLKQPLMIIAIIGLPVLVGLTAGSYPAFYLSRTRPLQFLKGGPGIAPRKSFTRKVLVVFQFTTAVVLTTVAIVVLSQIQFSRNWDKGFDDQNVMILESEDDQAAIAFGPLKTELMNDPGVLGVAACDMLPGTQSAALNLFQPPDQPNAERVLVRMFSVDQDFASVLGLDLAAGRYLSTEDVSSDGRNVVLDQRAVAALGLQEPVGARIVKDSVEYNVVGVLNDFHAVPTFAEDWPMMLYVTNGALHFLLVRLQPGNTADTIDRIKAIWERSVPTQPFEYSYYDQVLARLYGDHEKFGTLLGIFSLIALVIAGLGVFSLASYAAERRRREIGIRKVVGATVGSVLRLLSSQFIVLVLFASVIGCPIAWYLSNRWLERFVYRVDVGIGLFLLAGAISLAVALISVSYQAIRASRANPIEALRYE